MYVYNGFTCCTVETNPTLQINYTPIKINQKNTQDRLDDVTLKKQFLRKHSISFSFLFHQETTK